MKPMRPNLLRARLNEGKPTIGFHLLAPSPELLEIIGLTGAVDYVEFVGQYSTYDLAWLDTLGRITELYDMSSMIKVDQSLQTFQAQRAVGAGIQSILFTDLRNVQETEEAVKSIRPDTPEGRGILGVSQRRNYRYFLESGSPALPQVYRDIVVAVMIEKKGAVDDLEKILKLDDVDMIQWGSGDYAFNVGRSGEREADEFKEIERYVIDTCLKHNKPPRIELRELDNVEEYLNMGIKHFCVGFDTRIIYQWVKTNGEKLRSLLG
ncbi:MAG: aldolase/citrate lyase family protein [Thermaerobacterales bacterium]